MEKTYVYIYLKDGAVPAGLLETVGEGREASARFRYGRHYLARKERLAIDPVQLPLHDPEVDAAQQVSPTIILFLSTCRSYNFHSSNTEIAQPPIIPQSARGDESMRFLRSYIVLVAVLVSTPYVFCWQGNTPETALEEMVTTDKIEVMAKHLPVKVEEAINNLDDKGKKEVAAKLLPQSVMKREGEVFARSDDGTQWELRNEKKEVEGTIKLLNSFISGSDALLSLEFTEHPPSQNGKHSDSDENPLPQHSREPSVMLISMKLERGEWRILGFGPWEKKSLENEDFLRGIVPNPQETNARTAVSTLHQLNHALAAYATTYPEVGFPTSLQQLGSPAFQQAQELNLTVDPALMVTPAIKDGYEFRYAMIELGTTDPETQKGQEGRYRITATPVKFGITGSRSFFTDETQVVRSTNENREANENDEPM